MLVFSDDWGRHPSSCQHLVRRLLPEVPTTWVNTIGMRPPRLDWLTLQRGAGKIAGWLKRPPTDESAQGATDLPAGLSVIDAKMWPWMTRGHDRWLNQQLLTRQLFAAAQDAVVITTIPIVADLVGHLPAKRWVYYCVDDFSVWPGLDSQMLGQMENALLPKMDVIVAASDTLAAGIASRGHHAEVLTHGVDLDFWNQPLQNSENDPLVDHPQIAADAAPFVLFWGVVDRRLNADWVLALADAMSAGTIVLAGPQQDPDPRLHHHQRISLTGAVPFESLPALAKRASILIMPYADLPVTRAMQPLKLKEYLATGLPVVASSLPSTSVWQDGCDVVTTSEDFVAATLERIGSGVTTEQTAAREKLHQESWLEKSAEFMTMAARSTKETVETQRVAVCENTSDI
ncbi:glycosyltransferase [Rhodopirellula sp. SWK7]|uniref:glycosyltransferase n=1 Tax=Rhodopirellula sp. SWK7 TaxID=595460 RepID=UPI00034D57BF|nr:glycosyltransferase [Rhodopirellula sp. SWK7]